jgi:hypothetical protein
MATPRKEVDKETLEKLFYMQCTQTEIMGWFGIQTKDTLNNRIREIYGEDQSYSTIYEQKRQGGRIAVRRKQMQVAESGNVSMLIWLGKQYLGQSDKNEVQSEETVTVKISGQRGD